ncbi:TadE/TadG family type IV pilus assembly protein [Sedimentimonas flavescens]|uniref:TadE/TadG family type IV pilus assembly protein n=1 Tax=Sedimentimonas flavescens TaxID=2851012 RepID=UPI001F4341AC|nr:TadE family protein [Sedimentimonas flavescens]WBL34351.1 pilus assembly protein [Sinirhodobacter sp. HNIBRBA609]
MSSKFRGKLSSFGKGEDGAQLVEFAIVLPMMLLVFAVIIEGARMMRTYQAVSSGVRDAARYVARVAPANICVDTGSAQSKIATYDAELKNIVEKSQFDNVLFPSGATINTVSSTVTCPTGTFAGYPPAIVQVTASMTLTFLFDDVFKLIGGSLDTLNTTVVDQSRVYGI